MNVLILTDLSSVARNAGSYAVQFLSKVPVHFYMLNIDLFNPDLEEDRAQERMYLILAKINKRISELKLISSGSDHKFTSLYSADNHISATRKLVADKNIDLIVMGAAYKGHSPHTIIGNLTYEIIKKIRCNILAVAENCRYRKPKKIVFPIDYSASLDNNVFGFLNHPNVAVNSAITLLEIKRAAIEPDSYYSSVKELLQLKNKKVKIMELPEGRIDSTELFLEIQEKYDMIAMLGKNIRICEILLHNKKGIYSTVANDLPILVLHGRDM